MSKITVLSQNTLESIRKLNAIKVDGAYIVMDSYDEFSVICQYSEKYDSFHIVTVKTDRLNKDREYKPYLEKYYTDNVMQSAN